MRQFLVCVVATLATLTLIGTANAQAIVRPLGRPVVGGVGPAVRVAVRPGPLGPVARVGIAARVAPVRPGIVVGTPGLGVGPVRPGIVVRTPGLGGRLGGVRIGGVGVRVVTPGAVGVPVAVPVVGGMAVEVAGDDGE
jgi:hypothetical protein